MRVLMSDIQISTCALVGKILMRGRASMDFGRTFNLVNARQLCWASATQLMGEMG